MSKCNRVKNPCKICLGPVSQKNGLQCQGACQSWVHYSCLNYTPGKVKDIKAGIIKVTCPCPDCKTSVPKEYRTDQPFSCNNTQCPANRPPKCENMRCPINKNREPRPIPIPCPLSTCGNDCKEYSHPISQGATPPNYGGCPPPRPCNDTPGGSSCFDPNRCDSGCSSTETYPSPPPVCDPPPPCAVPNNVMEQMCNTVGQLTNQINCLMNKMKQVVNDNKSRGGSAGPTRPPCAGPKPCYCPGNPARK